MNLEICFAEFGPRAVEPNLAHFRKVWPDATFHVSHAGNTPDVPQLEPSNQFYPMRMHNYWQAKRMLASRADVIIALDSDMWVQDIEAARKLPEIAMRFGLCAPINPRRLLSVDIRKGVDSDREQWPFGGLGMPINCSPIACAPRARLACEHLATVKRFTESMEVKPHRGTVTWVRAEYSSKWPIYKLPIHWCVCQEDVGIGDEIMLHIGHGRVQEFYGRLYRPKPLDPSTYSVEAALGNA